MRYYPALLDLQNRLCCVVGGGAVAVRKVRSLQSAGARVKVVSLRVSKSMQALADRGRIALIKSAYNKKYISGAFIVIAATSDPAVNRRISEDASSLRIPANIVDDPSLSSFIVPAVLSKKGLIISISTSGLAPALSRRIKQDLAGKLLGKYVRALAIMRKKRLQVKKSAMCLSERKRLLTAMADRALKTKI
jgi:siroheme synthase-like protein